MRASVTPPATPVWPAAVPPEVDTTLVGRDPIVAELTAALLRGQRRVIALTGLGGVGKTRLAIEIARRADEQWSGRVAWDSARERHTPRWPCVRHRRRAGALGGGEPDHLADAVAETIGEEPALFVLDSAETARRDLGLLDDLVAVSPPRPADHRHLPDRR